VSCFVTFKKVIFAEVNHLSINLNLIVKSGLSRRNCADFVGFGNRFVYKHGETCVAPVDEMNQIIAMVLS
jgi:hypothetical protein